MTGSGIHALTAQQAAEVADRVTAYITHQQGPCSWQSERLMPLSRHWASADRLAISTFSAEVSGPRAAFTLRWSRVDVEPTVDWVVATLKTLCVLAGLTV